ncbi:hypothetical protein [Chryseobacterium phocaeense]|uniref:hypothetical protein n=1 Tax=Chryseobacterium phocaeense TaxID=1816690 RepID=UPI0009BC2E8D|nr:hypothetical protein [Chryseobacterium phocaeense]
MKKLLVVGLMMSNLAFAQNTVHMETKAYENTQKMNPFKKGSVMIFWGWNNAKYSKSDIRFKGDGYDFQLENVAAQDRQTKFDWGIYFNPGNLTIPQVNYRITYFPKDNFGITVGMDHMKYVMDQDQTVNFKGHISDPQYAAMVNNGQINLSDANFLTFEHTDGLNYINIGAQKYHNVLDKKNIDLFLSYGAGIGALLPKSNVKLMGNERSDRFHLAGFGTDIRAAVNLILISHIVLQAEGKLGYINMPDIKTTLNNKPDKASQDFVYAQFNFGIGYTFNTKKYN